MMMITNYITLVARSGEQEITAVWLINAKLLSTCLRIRFCKLVETDFLHGPCEEKIRCFGYICVYIYINTFQQV